MAKRKNSTFCNNKCSSQYKVKHRKPINPEIRKQRSEAARQRVLEEYKSGKKQALGGRTKWYSYKNIKVQGSYEYRTCFVLDNFVEHGALKSWDYTNDRIPYIKNNGKNATYLFDFKVYRNDGTFFYIETKGFKRENDDLKWEAAKSLGLCLIVWFKEDIERAEQNMYNPNLV